MNKYVALLTKVHIHPLFWLLSGIAVVTAHFKQLLILVSIVFIHELGHAVVAQRFSWRVKRILLLPFGGVAEVDEHGNRPFREELLVTLAGPAQHVWLVGGAFLLWKYDMLSHAHWQLFFRYNIVIGALNLMPIWPLDGGKLLFLLLTRFLPFSRAHRQMIIYSYVVLFVAIGGVFLFAPKQFDLWLIVVFLLFSLWKEWKYHPYIVTRFLLERYYGKKGQYAKWRPLTVEETETVWNVLNTFYRGQKHSIVVVKQTKERAILDENELLHAAFADKQPNIPVGRLIYE